MKLSPPSAPPAPQVDGLEPSARERRNELFGISSLRGKYPQVFLKLSGETTFVGDFEAVNGLNDCDTLPPDVLEANPQIETFSKKFAPVKPT